MNLVQLSNTPHFIQIQLPIQKYEELYCTQILLSIFKYEQPEADQILLPLKNGKAHRYHNPTANKQKPTGIIILLHKNKVENPQGIIILLPMKKSRKPKSYCLESPKVKQSYCNHSCCGCKAQLHKKNILSNALLVPFLLWIKTDTRPYSNPTTDLVLPL